MNPDDQFWQDIAPIRKGRRNAFGRKKAATLKIGVPILIASDSNLPPHIRQWTWASALILHLGFFMALLTIPPIELPPKNIVKVEIINAPKPPTIEAPVIASKSVAPPKPEILQPLPEEAAPQEPPPIEAIATPKLQPTPAISIQPPPLDALLPDAIVNPLNIESSKRLKSTTPKILPQATQQIEDEPEEQVAVPELRPIAPSPQAVLQNRQFDLQRPIVPKEIAGQSKLKKQQISKIAAPNVRPIDIEELNRLEAQRALEAARQSAAPANTAPVVKGGELAAGGGGVPAPSGGSPSAPPSSPSGVTSVVGGGAPAGSGGNSGATGALPRQPRGPTIGRNVFENGEASGGLAGMRRIGECAEINRERSDRCPDWNPLEPGRRNNVNVPVPKSVVPRTPPTDPLPLCPPGTPHSNFGITCLPSGKQ